MNIEDLAGIGVAEPSGQYLHVARQYHGIGLCVAEERVERLPGGFLIGLVHGYVVERDAVPLDQAAGIFVIGDDARNFDVQLAGTPALQQVVETVHLARYEHNDAFFDGAVGQPPVHGQLVCERRKLRGQHRQVTAERVGVDLDAHIKAASDRVRVLARA